MNEMFPTEEQLRMLREHPDDVPVIMLNLMKFKERSDDGDGTGWDAYVRYSKATAPLIKEQGGRIIWTGKIEQLALGAMEGGLGHGRAGGIPESRRVHEDVCQ